MRWFAKMAGMGGCLISLCACAPVTESERAYFESREKEQEQQQAFIHAMAEANSIEGALVMVKEYPAPDESGSTEQWIEREQARLSGDVLFPRWEGLRKGPNKFDVLFTYTHRDQDYNIVKKGYGWEVDTLLKLVTGPRDLDDAEMETRPRRTAAQNEYETLRKEFSLE